MLPLLLSLLLLLQVQPLRKQLKTLKAWITGQRKDQSPGTRMEVPVVQVSGWVAGLGEQAHRFFAQTAGNADNGIKAASRSGMQHGYCCRCGACAQIQSMVESQSAIPRACSRAHSYMCCKLLSPQQEPPQEFIAACMFLWLLLLMW